MQCMWEIGALVLLIFNSGQGTVHKSQATKGQKDPQGNHCIIQIKIQVAKQRQTRKEA